MLISQRDLQEYTASTEASRICHSIGNPDKIFSSPEHLIDYFINYCNFLKKNQIPEEIAYKGTTFEINHAVMPTIQGFAIFIGVDVESLSNYSQKPEYTKLFKYIRDSMYATTIEGAAAGIFKEALSIRNLGLADKKEIEKTERRVVTLHTYGNGRSVDIEDAEEV